MKKILFIGLYLFTSSIWGYDDTTNLPEIQMRRDHHHKSKCKRHKHHSECLRGATGSTGPTGPRGPTGNAGVTGATAAFSPSFGAFYSTTGQTVPSGGAVYFGITGVGPIGTAFSFDPGTDTSGSTFLINETGYYDISYGLFGGTYITESPPLLGVGLMLNTTSITGSYYFPGDNYGDFSMPSFEGIFHLGSTGTLQLINISPLDLIIIPPSSPSPSGPGATAVDISAYFNIQFLSAD